MGSSNMKSGLRSDRLFAVRKPRVAVAVYLPVPADDCSGSVHVIYESEQLILNA